MVTNVYFNNFGFIPEQDLLDDLVIESIRIYGQDMYYLPRRRNNFDQIYYDDDISSFDTFYLFEIYIKSFDGFSGDGTLFTQFNLEIRDQIQFTIARKTFHNEVTLKESDILRPREGDLIYFPLNRKCFEIKYVENKPFFYQLGELQMYDLTCELYRYSNEVFETGIPEIDQLQLHLSFNTLDYAITAANGSPLMTINGDYLVSHKLQTNLDQYDPTQDNEDIEQEIDNTDLIDWSEDNPFAEGDY